MHARHTFTQKKSLHIGRWIFLLIVIAVIRIGVAFTRPISLTQSVVVKKGDTINVFLSHLTGRERVKLKSYIKTHSVDLGNLQLGTYQFSGSYTPEQFLHVITAGPASEYIRFTVLEGRSIYDIDAMLADKGFAAPGAYLSYVSSGALIDRIGEQYSYIGSAHQTDQFKTLEGWLYPDTYFLDPSKDPITQLVKLQIKAFDEKVYQPYASAITAFPSLLKAKGYNISYTMDLWNILRLASIVEKEEKNNQNKPTVAGIFFNRFAQGMSLGADITLCYGLKKPYAACTPAVINANITDTSNPYNTRVVRGLPPTPICNPAMETIRAVLEFNATDYLYYIHDTNGVIRYSKDIQGHNNNISKYLK